MKSTDFASYLTKYFTNYLPQQRNVSKNTIYSYRDTFKLLLQYVKNSEHLPAEKITIESLDQNTILGFLNWIENKRMCSISTRNQRLAAIHSFFRYVQYESPTLLQNFHKILSIPFKKVPSAIVEYLKPEAMKYLLSQPDKTTKRGRRDLTLLSTLYDTGARVQELIDIKICDVAVSQPTTIILKGKGDKQRRVPIMKQTALLIDKYIMEQSLSNPYKNTQPLFVNSRGEKLTREGIAYIINKYNKGKSHVTSLPLKITPHMFRHSKAMHLLNAGINLIYIRDFLGHVDVKTTETYTRADIETKRVAIQNACPDIIDANLPDWNRDSNLILWLSSLS